jgi:hypothetical protein
MRPRPLTMLWLDMALALLLSITGRATAAEVVDVAIWNEGDAWTYRTTQLPHFGSPGTWYASYEFVVTKRNAEYYTVTRTDRDDKGVKVKETTQRWSFILNRLSRVRDTRDWQEFLRYQWPLEPGRRWQAPYQGSDFDTLWDVKVGDWTEVSVPAGSFHAIRIQLDRTGKGGTSYKKQEVIWYAPSVKRHVKVETYESQGGYSWGHAREELVKFSSAR